MAKHDDGGPAFPLWHHGEADGREWPCPGMSLFRYYVGQALAGKVLADMADESSLALYEIAQKACELAEAVIAEIRRREAE